jgi:hypothetical protein
MTTTPREYQPHPGSPIDTVLGPITATATSADHVYVSAGNRHQEPLVINGVEYSLSMHLQAVRGTVSLQPDSNGGTYHSIHLTRRNWTNYNESHGTPSARKRAEMIVIAAVQRWINEHPDVLREADQTDRNNKARKLETEIAELEAELTEKRAELAELGV